MWTQKSSTYTPPQITSISKRQAAAKLVNFNSYRIDFIRRIETSFLSFSTSPLSFNHISIRITTLKSLWHWNIRVKQLKFKPLISPWISWRAWLYPLSHGLDPGIFPLLPPVTTSLRELLATWHLARTEPVSFERVTGEWFQDNDCAIAVLTINKVKRYKPHNVKLFSRKASLVCTARRCYTCLHMLSTFPFSGG